MKKQSFATVTADQMHGDEPRMTITTIGLDRDHDEIVPEGIDLNAYMRNPVVLWAHSYDAIPVGTTTALDVVPGKGIRARWRWLENDDFAARVRNAYDQGILRSASVGFRAIDSERNAYGGKRYTSCELLEWSLVPVPANAECVRTLKSLGLMDDERVVLTLRDDTTKDDGIATRADVVAALREAVPSFARQAVREQLMRRHPLSDPFVGDELRRAIRDAVAAVKADLPDIIEKELKRARGRVD